MKRKLFRWDMLSKIGCTAILAALCVNASAQSAHTVYADFGTRVAGPDSEFTINVTMSPADVDISGFSFRIAYDNTQVVLESVSDNTGQPGAGVEYTIGQQQVLTGVDKVNVYVPVIMDTAFNLENPTNLVQLHFRSSTTYNDPNNRIWLHMENHLGEGLVDGNLQPIPTEYQVDQEVPVTLSGFSLE